MRTFSPSLLFLIALLASASTRGAPTLWYAQPAGKWEEAVPLGNGKLGIMVYGGVDKERLLMNEGSLWSGWPVPDADREGSFDALQRARALLREKKSGEAAKILLDDFCSLRGYGKADFGAYQSFFDAWITTPHAPGGAKEYRRDLDLSSGVATVRYEIDGVRHLREVFCSHPAGVAVVRLSASKPGQVSFTLDATSLHKDVTVTAGEGELVLAGRVDNGKGNPQGMQFEGRIRVRAEGGTVAAAGKSLAVTGADSVVLLIAGATDHKLEHPAYRGGDPAAINRATLDAAAGASFDDLLAAHRRDHGALFNATTLRLDGVSRDDLPTNLRLAEYKKGRADRGLEALVFDYGRYLLIASSRAGGLPANLQGLWNNTNSPPWMGDYHLNINLQMNYWPAGNTGLSECFEPLARWVRELAKPGAQTARVHYNAGGWVAHHVANVWGVTAPGPKRGIHMLEAESAAFICQNIWDHYAFTQDRAYLENTAWPLLRGASEFWVDALQEAGGGVLAVNPSFSPEHGPLSDGTYYQTMIVHDLFTNTIAAGRVLGRDEGFLAKLDELRGRLQKPRIGSRGQLCEWRDDAIEEEMLRKDPHHRHMSHMYAVYPGFGIVPGRDPELAAAARKSMELRGDEATGWSMGWKVNVWARLLDGDRAHRLAGNLIAGKLFPNLWDAHPPFQIDGNFGYTAGVAEMLVQSRMENGEYRIDLLPALPKDWPAGAATGLGARGGFLVDVAWRDGLVTAYQVRRRPGLPPARVEVGVAGKAEVVEARE
ncbi:MAG: glycoside hydrolase family 95 protein [Kiritimatiellia bacterium]